MTIAPAEINRIAQDAASAKLSVQVVEAVISEPMIDSTGRDALRITIIIRPDKVAAIKGDALLATLREINVQLSQAGEERLPVVYYATKEELSQSGDTES